MAVAQRKAASDSPVTAGHAGNVHDFFDTDEEAWTQSTDTKNEALERKRMQMEEKLGWAASVTAQQRAVAEERLREFCEEARMRSHDQGSGTEISDPMAIVRHRQAERAARKHERHVQLCHEVVQD